MSRKQVDKLQERRQLFRSEKKKNIWQNEYDYWTSSRRTETTCIDVWWVCDRQCVTNWLADDCVQEPLCRHQYICDLSTDCRVWNKKQAIKMSIKLVKWVEYSSYAWKKPLVITFYLQWMQISIKRCFGNWLTWSIIRINQRHFSPLFVTFNQMFADQYKKKLVCDIVVRSHEANWRQFLSTSHHFRY